MFGTKAFLLAATTGVTILALEIQVYSHTSYLQIM
jgi:hypothetical protein